MPDWFLRGRNKKVGKAIENRLKTTKEGKDGGTGCDMGGLLGEGTEPIAQAGPAKRKEGKKWGRMNRNLKALPHKKQNNPSVLYSQREEPPPRKIERRKHK